MTDRSYPKVYIDRGGDRLVIQTGGKIQAEPGAVCGVVSNGVSAVDNVTAAASNNAFVDFVQTVTIPASTLNSGQRIRVKANVRVTNASGTDTLTCKVKIGSTDLISTTAVDPGAAGDSHQLEYELTVRADAGAAVSCQGYGKTVTNTGGTLAHGAKCGADGASSGAEFNLATNGDLIIAVSGKWSSNTASTSARLENLTVEVE